MSRVGQAIINIPNGVEVKKENNQFIVKGSKGELSAPVSNTVDVTINDNIIRIEPKTKTPLIKQCGEQQELLLIMPFMELV